MVDEEDIQELELLVNGDECRIRYWVSSGLNTRVCVEVYDTPEGTKDYDTYLKKDETPQESALRGLESFFDKVKDVEVRS